MRSSTPTDTIEYTSSAVIASASRANTPKNARTGDVKFWKLAIAAAFGIRTSYPGPSAAASASPASFNRRTLSPRSRAS
jgi:hypothetical protein